MVNPVRALHRLRSLLFVPGHQPHRFDKAMASNADAVILDLEDAVGPDHKGLAREAIARWLRPEKPVLLRTNAIDSTWFFDDCELLKLPGLLGVVLPKTEQADGLQVVREHAPHLPLFPMIESAHGFAQRNAIAAAHGVARLVFGHLDFQADLGLHALEDDLLPFRTELVLCSRLANLAAPIDGVSTTLADEMLLQTDAARARRLGFGGKLCIHPRQIATINTCFTPNQAEIAWAQRVLAADAASGGAAVAVGGRMVDRPVVLRAHSILRDAGMDCA